ncbi:pimeloyl-ACP methyl ester esterase BioH [Dickeya sp. CFBP 2040]|uniref:pimeloyl-ACP methyl ester esterase BioH n=1 Tax=Dickeya sp. CFBP 2040 TaxID=2718531 RepID=UPI001446F239|nr:pimeloyl-ACP methyl ester esterase BioH [Dickeya sp. CFBP 2040]NKI75678.1 pimeloyl-ACP methyl ester esterase BioH [Dickeya sp. CFBP 2040]
MGSLHWQTEGEGRCELVMLHGWGMNSQVWNSIVVQLAPHFRLHRVDLPGYGQSQAFGAMPLIDMVQQVLAQAPERAVWLGWSLGGLVASQAALSAPERVSALITLASSPCFEERDGWPGIRPQVLSGFQRLLSDDFFGTIERFLALQTLGTESARKDARALKLALSGQPSPSTEVLTAGLGILRDTDLREPLRTLTMPFLRLYGALDGLVPRKVAALMDEQYPHSTSVVIPKAAHAPFISHPEMFVEQVVNFVQESVLVGR